MASGKAIFGSAMLAIAIAAPQNAKAVAPGANYDPKTKVICRESTPVGSFIAKEMTCLSRAAWEKNREDRKEEDDFSREFLQLKQPQQPEILQLGHAKWDSLPQLQAKGKVPYLQLVKHTRELLRTGTCNIPGQKTGKFDIVVRYGVKFDAGGNVSRVLVEDSSCSVINAMVGMTVLARAERGDFAGSSRSTGWFGDTLNLTLQ